MEDNRELTPEEIAQKQRDFQKILDQETKGFEHLKNNPDYDARLHERILKRNKEKEPAPMTEKGKKYIKAVNNMGVNDGSFNVNDVLKRIKLQGAQGKRFHRKDTGISYEDGKTVLMAIGRQKFGPDFKVDQYNADLYRKLLKYFCNIPGELDIKKGLYIFGAVGRGKSASFSIFQSFVKVCQIPDMEFKIKSTVAIPFELTGKKNLSDIKKYFTGLYMFDDFGQEDAEFSFYNNKVRVMEEIMTMRYNRFQKSGQLTFVTSNFTPESLQEMYGDRLFSRFREMFNYVPISGEDRRK